MRFFKGEALNLLKQHQATTADLSSVVIIFKESHGPGRQDISGSTNTVNKMAVYQKMQQLFMYFPVEMARIAQFYACYGFNKFLVWFIISALADQEVIFTQAEMIFISDRRKVQ